MGLSLILAWNLSEESGNHGGQDHEDGGLNGGSGASGVNSVVRADRAGRGAARAIDVLAAIGVLNGDGTPGVGTVAQAAARVAGPELEDSVGTDNLVSAQGDSAGRAAGIRGVDVGADSGVQSGGSENTLDGDVEGNRLG